MFAKKAKPALAPAPGLRQGRRGSLWRRRPGILEGKIILGKIIKNF
jgi:hypothetical protein